MSAAAYLLALLSAIVLSIPSLHGLAWATKNNQLASIARLIGSFLALVICACYGVVASIVLRLTGYGGLSQWTTARSFKLAMWLLTGVTFAVEDKEGGLKVGPCVFVGNHQTELDVLMLGCMFPPYCSVSAKSSLKWTPFLGQFMALSKTVFINRASSKESRAAFSSAVEMMHAHQQSVYIFPEGTRSYSDKPDMLPFKKGAFHLAIEAQVPVVPVVVANYSNVLNVKRRIFNSGTVPVSILKPVETKGLTKDDVEDLMKRVRAVMQPELVRISRQAVQEGIARPDEAANGLLLDGASDSHMNGRRQK